MALFGCIHHVSITEPLGLAALSPTKECDILGVGNISLNVRFWLNPVFFKKTLNFYEASACLNLEREMKPQMDADLRR